MKLPIKTQFLFSASLLFLTNICYMIWSFGFTDPNLVLSSWAPFWSFQQFMWQLPKHNMTVAYVVMFMIMLWCSWRLSQIAEKLHFGFKKWLMIFFFVTSPLIFSNNALSHDVFNYIFNARMVVKYQMNPHVEVAQHFFYDPWIRFMHNVHTPAPYFYGWTALSLLPYVLGFEKFLLTWILFRLWSELGFLLSMVMLWLVMKKQGKVDLKSFVLLLFNPLLIIEIISNSHNDGWMMWLALASLYMVMKGREGSNRPNMLQIVGSFVLLLLSMSTKYATAILLPVWLIMVGQQFDAINKFLKVIQIKLKLLAEYFNLFDLSAVLLFLPLLTERSQQFHPWYLSWSLLFYPLMKNRFLKMSLIVLSVSSLWRYIPWMWNGAFNYTTQIEIDEKLVTWVPFALFFVLWGLNSGRKFFKRA